MKILVIIKKRKFSNSKIFLKKFNNMKILMIYLYSIRLILSLILINDIMC